MSHTFFSHIQLERQGSQKQNLEGIFLVLKSKNTDLRQTNQYSELA